MQMYNIDKYIFVKWSTVVNDLCRILYAIFSALTKSSSINVTGQYKYKFVNLWHSVTCTIHLIGDLEYVKIYNYYR